MTHSRRQSPNHIKGLSRLPHQSGRIKPGAPLPSLIGAVLTLVWVGCGSSTPKEAEHGLVRIQVARLQLPITDPKAEQHEARIEAFRKALDACKAQEAYALAAEVETYWGRYLESRNELDAAVAHYEEALRYDKLEHYRQRSELNTTANSAAMAVSLANLSMAKEKQGKYFEAITYAERAFRINANLGLVNRMKIDCERLAHLHAQWGDKSAATSYRQMAEELAVNTTKPNVPLPLGLAPIPGSNSTPGAPENGGHQ